MNEKFIKFLGLASTVALSCTLVNAADIPVKEIQPRGTVLPAVIMPAQDSKAEDKVLQPATDVKKEVKEEVKAVEEKVKETTEEVKTEVKKEVLKIEEKAETTKEAAKTGAEEAKKADKAPDAQVPAAFEALQKVETKVL